MTTADLWDKLALSTADAISQIVTAKVEAFMQKFCKAQVKVVYREAEAAEFLCCSPELLASYRKRKLIQYAAYPQARKDELGDLYTYSIADLLSFRERYLIKAQSSQNVFEINPTVSLAGPEVMDSRKRAA